MTIVATPNVKVPEVKKVKLAYSSQVHSIRKFIRNVRCERHLNAIDVYKPIISRDSYKQFSVNDYENYIDTQMTVSTERVRTVTVHEFRFILS